MTLAFFSGTILIENPLKGMIRVNSQNLPKKSKKATDPEVRLAVFFLIFSVLIVAITACLVVWAFLPTPEATYIPNPGEPSDQPDTPPQPSNPDDDPTAPFVPIFGGSSVPALPHTVEGTKTISSEIASEYGVLVDAATGEILLSKGHDVRFNPASMTKVMTLIALCENLSENDLEKEITMTAALREYVTTGAYKDSGCFGFLAGDKIKVKDLLYGIGVESDADCTVLVVKALYEEDSEAVAEQKLVALMNQRVQALGLKNTHFDNIIGHESDNNYTTAADMAAIMMYAMKCPLIVEILSAKNYVFYIQRLEEDGETYARWTMRYYSSLFNNKREKETSRIYAYEKKFGTFSIDGAALSGGKTGTLGVGSESDPWIYSLVSFAKTSDGKIYIAVTGKSVNAYDVMKDAKALYEGVNS